MATADRLEQPAAGRRGAAARTDTGADLPGARAGRAAFLGGTPEQRLILACARLPMTPDDVARARATLAETGHALDWGTVFWQGIRHKVLPLIAYNLISRVAPTPEEASMPLAIRNWLRHSYFGNLGRNQELLAELRVLLRALHARGLACVLRKGAYLATEVYRDPGVRVLNDLDLLVRRSDIGAIQDCLHELGYQQGSRAGGRAIVPDAREKVIYWRLYMNNERPYMRIVDTPGIEELHVDLCFNLFLPKSGLTLPTEDVFARARPHDVGGEPTLVMDDVDMLIDLCGHLYKEATSLWWIHHGKDLHLAKFIDVAAFAAAATGRDAGFWSSALATVSRYRLQKPVFYALAHTAVLFPDSVPAQVLDAVRPEDEGYLDEYGGLELGAARRWEGDFVSRLFATDRAAQAPDARVPE